MGDMLDAALAYAGIGWPVLPLVPREKRPLTQHGSHDATTDPDVIRSWWSSTPEANLGLATGGGGLVIDIDPRHDGDAAWVELLSQHGPVPRTVTCATGGGGWHLWYNGLAGYHLPSEIAPGVDCKNEGGYVVAPPSIHPSGTPYSWIHSPLDYDPSPCPPWLATLLLEHVDRPMDPVDTSHPAPVSIVERCRRYLSRCDRSISGQYGHRSLFHAAMVCSRGFRLGEGQALDLLREFNMANCSPPWPERELLRKLRQAASRGKMVEGSLL